MPGMSVAAVFAFLASSGVWRFRVGRSGSSAEEGLLEVVEEVSVVVSGLRRCMVGRLGSSAGVLVEVVVDAVVSLPDVVLSGVWRFMVGRSGSSAGAEPVSVGVLDAVVDVPDPDGSGLRRFMVGRLGSSLVEGVVVLAGVVSGLL